MKNTKLQADSCKNKFDTLEKGNLLTMLDWEIKIGEYMQMEKLTVDKSIHKIQL